MSRHRNLRKVSIGDDDYDDDISQSFDEKYSYAVSPGTSEMYMFNRNNDQTSMSDFIKGKIMEEDDDNNEHDHDSAQALGNNINTDEKKTDDLTGRIGSLDVGLVKNVKSDEDFVFQMDKDSGKTTIAQLDLNEKDDIESLIKRRYFTNNTNNNDIDTEDVQNKTIIDGESSSTVLRDLAENSQDENELSSLAKKYQFASNQPHLHDSKTFPQLMYETESDNQLSSSIDKILNSFFTSQFEQQHTKQIQEELNDDDVEENVNFYLDKHSTVKMAQYQRTKSISMSESGKVNHNSQPGAEVSFSLDDLANEYLAKTTGSTTPTHNPASFASSLADLIDSEFNQRLSISNDNQNKSTGLLESSIELSSSNLINLNKENLLINRRDMMFNRSSINIDPKVQLGGSTPALKSYTKSDAVPETKIQFIKQNFIHAHCENIMFLIKLRSNLSDLLSLRPTEDVLNLPVSDARFDYDNQIKSLQKFQEMSDSKRKKIVVDLAANAAKKRKPNNQINSKVDPTKQTTSKSTKKNQTQSKSSSSAKRLKPFDFSIPSPDDVVIAKQKFAFKNIKFNK